CSRHRWRQLAPRRQPARVRWSCRNKLLCKRKENDNRGWLKPPSVYHCRESRNSFFLFSSSGNVMRVIISSVCAAVMAASMAAHAQTVQLGAPLASALNYLDVTRAGVRVVAVGDRGNILFSDDEGETWQAAQTPTDALLTAVCFADARHGWAVGHDAIVLATEDGGQTWTQQYSDPLGGAADEEEDYAEEESYDDYDNYDDYDSYEDFDE